MDDNLHKAEFNALLNITAPLIAEHIEPDFDEMVAMWLDPIGKYNLCSKYAVGLYLYKDRYYIYIYIYI